MTDTEKPKRGRPPEMFKIDIPFEEALRVVVETKPTEKRASGATKPPKRPKK